MSITTACQLCVVLVWVTTAFQVSFIKALPVSPPMSKTGAHEDAHLSKPSEIQPGEARVFLSFGHFPGQLGVFGHRFTEKLSSSLWNFFGAHDISTRRDQNK
ncbi:hypothetical protein ElyMa_007057400, partial [Elysia marginata]